jgi:hypothetical protein
VDQRVLVDGIGYQLRPSSEEELVRGVMELDARTRAEHNPRIVEILATDGGEDPPALSIGVGGQEYVLVFNEGNLSGEGGYSKGPHDGDSTEISFAYGDSDSFYERWMLVDRDTAVNAAREFYRTGRRPANVRWEDF